ncbi:nitrophenyl compound nitroreductase subunit ArsF family protein [Nanoarchaeota archaeon]
MKSKYILLTLVLMLSLFIIGCGQNQVNGNSVADTDSCSGDTCEAVTATNGAGVEKLEIYHFHGTNQCYSCITVGDYAEETVNTYFSDELKSGKIVFGHINYDLAHNLDLAQKYGVTGSSLWIGVYDGSGFSAEVNTNVWYKINDKRDYINYLKGVIEEKLAGN